MKTFEQRARVLDLTLTNGKIIKVAFLSSRPKQEGLCKGCSAPCCKGSLKPVLDVEEFLSRKYKSDYTPIPDWLKKQLPMAEFVATLAVDIVEGCPYHDKNTGKCTIWPECPKSCLSYDCRQEEREPISTFAKEREKIWQE